MTGINIRVKHERYSEDYEFEFLQKLTQWVNDYWEEVEKNE